MIKLSNIDSYTEVPIKINEPEETIEHDVERHFGTSLLFGNTLITRHANRIKIWDITNITAIHLISTTQLGWGGSGHIEKEGQYLYLAYQEKSKLDKILVLDLSDLSNPILVRTIDVPEYISFFIDSETVYLISRTEKAVITVDKNDEKTKIIDLSHEDETMFFDTSTNCIKSGNNIFIASRHRGFHVYTKTDANVYEFQSKHQPANGYLPTGMQWLIPDQQILLIGNDNVVQYDLTNLKKLKRYKAAKIKTKATYGAFVERDQELLILGNTGAKDKFVIAVLTPNEKGIALTHKPKIEYKLRKTFAGNVKMGETVKGFVLNGDFLLIIGQHTGFFLLKANG